MEFHFFTMAEYENIKLHAIKMHLCGNILSQTKHKYRGNLENNASKMNFNLDK